VTTHDAADHFAALAMQAAADGDQPAADAWSLATTCLSLVRRSEPCAWILSIASFARRDPSWRSACRQASDFIAARVMP
jgi:hypothetical protein